MPASTCEAATWQGDAKTAVPMHIICYQIPYPISGWWLSNLGHFCCLVYAHKFCTRTAVSKIPVVACGTAWAEDGVMHTRETSLSFSTFYRKIYTHW